MNDQDYAAQRKKLTDLMDKWVPVFRLQGWHIRFEFLREPFPIQEGRDFHTVAITNTNWAYMQADIAFSVPDCATLTDERLEYVLVHELCHVMVNEMQNHASQDAHEERVVTMLANAFINADNRFSCDHPPPVEDAAELILTAV